MESEVRPTRDFRYYRRKQRDDRRAYKRAESYLVAVVSERPVSFSDISKKTRIQEDLLRRAAWSLACDGYIEITYEWKLRQAQ